jgi:hypothetical protein
MKTKLASIFSLGVLLALMIGGLGFSRPGQAAISYSWVGAGSGFWDEPSNWSPQGIPGPGDSVTIPTSSSPITVTVRASVSVASLDLAAPHTLEIEAGQAMTVTAGLQINSGNLVALGPVWAMGSSTWHSAGESSIRGTFTNQGVLTITGSGNNHRFRGLLTNHGTINHQAGKLYLLADPNQTTTLNNSIGAVYDFKSNETLVMACQAGSETLTFNNDGSLLKSAGNDVAAISTEGTGCSLAFNNNGLIDIQSGTLRFDLAFASAGDIHIAANTSLSVTVGFLILQGGRLSGTGSYYGNLINSGFISPGNSAGVLTLFGNYQDLQGVIEIELGGLTQGTQYDWLKINGNAGLGGELRISYLNNFVPKVGNSFTILSFNSHSNNFQTVTGTLKNSKLVISQTDVRLESWAPPVLLPVILKK